jgi:hypothetical protein
MNFKAYVQRFHQQESKAYIGHPHSRMVAFPYRCIEVLLAQIILIRWEATPWLQNIRGCGFFQPSAPQFLSYTSKLSQCIRWMLVRLPRIVGTPHRCHSAAGRPLSGVNIILLDGCPPQLYILLSIFELMIHGVKLSLLILPSLLGRLASRAYLGTVILHPSYEIYSIKDTPM